MADTPAFVRTPRCEVAQVSAANTNRDGTGTIVSVFTAGASGSRIRRIATKATGTTTAGMVRIYLYDGSNARLFHEFAVTAATPSGTVKSFEEGIIEAVNLDKLPLNLATGWSVRASTHNAETFNVIVEGGDL